MADDSVDDVARAVLARLAELPGVTRVGLGLVEGAGRRLRFTASGDPGSWCHIDAYDDVPLTEVVRTGHPVLGNLDDIAARFAGVVARQRGEGTRALAALPLPGPTGPLGGLILFYDADQAFDPDQCRLLETAARRAAEGFARARAGGRGAVEPADHEVVGGVRRAAMRLEPDPRSAGAARRFLRETFGVWGVDDDVLETAQLLTSELVNNVIMHAGTDAELSVSLGEGAVGVVVRDGGGSRPVAVGGHDPHEDLTVSGRGLVLVDALAERWGSDHDEGGTTSWFELSAGVRHALPGN